MAICKFFDTKQWTVYFALFAPFQGLQQTSLMCCGYVVC
jgi:hypothetical protein